MSELPVADQMCFNCLYFKKVDEHMGICRRYPPKQVHIDFNDDTDPVEAEVLSEVTEFDWCGEWKEDEPSE
jgi:hypothetical protein